MTALSDLLQKAVDDGITVKAALDRIEAAGLTVDRGQTYKALKGHHAKQPSEPVLKAWSVGFKIPITKMRSAVGVPAGELDPYEPPAYANRLNGDQRTALNELIRTIVEAGTGSWRDASSEDDTPAEGPPLDPFEPNDARNTTHEGTGVTSDEVSPTEP